MAISFIASCHCLKAIVNGGIAADHSKKGIAESHSLPISNNFLKVRSLLDIAILKYPKEQIRKER